MRENRTVVSTGMGFLDWLAILLTVAFVVLKLVSVIAWSWWLVFLPVIIALALNIILMVVLIIFANIINRLD